MFDAALFVCGCFCSRRVCVDCALYDICVLRGLCCDLLLVVSCCMCVCPLGLFMFVLHRLSLFR